MSGIDWEAAANHWIAQESAETSMPEADLFTEIEAFLARHKICTLATAGNGIVRNTTVEYLYAEGAFWIISEGGQKFRTLQANKNVCLAIHDDDISFATLAGLQVTGTAEVVEPFGEDYAHACELRGLPMERLRAMPFVMNIIKVTPTRFDYVNGTLKERGFSPRQHIEFRSGHTCTPPTRHFPSRKRTCGIWPLYALRWLQTTARATHTPRSARS